MSKKIINIAEDNFRLTGENIILDKTEFKLLHQISSIHKVGILDSGGTINSVKYYKNHEDMDLDNPCVVENYNYNLKANGCLSGVDLSYDYIMNNGLVGHTHTVFYSGHNMNALLSKNRIITMSFSDRRVGYSESTSCKYTTLGYLIFPGTMKVGIPDKIKMIAWKTNGTTSASIRVVCKDSGEVLCDLNDISNENQEIKLLENLNLELLKADESILMVQAKINGAKKSKIRIASIILEF